MKKEDIKTTLRISMRSSRNIELTLQNYIRRFRIDNKIHLVATDVEIFKKTMVVHFEGERIPCEKLHFWKNPNKKASVWKKAWIPIRTSIIRTIGDAQFLPELIKKKEEQLMRVYGKPYSIECISQTQMTCGDRRILLILLATQRK